MRRDSALRPRGISSPVPWNPLFVVVRIPTRNGSHFILLALKKEIRSASSEVRGRESHLLYHRCSGEMSRGPPLDSGPLPPHQQHQFFRLFQKEKGIGGGRADMRLSPTVGGSPDISLSFSPRERVRGIGWRGKRCEGRAGTRPRGSHFSLPLPPAVKGRPSP